jgi:signal transduction histidine kinase
VRAILPKTSSNVLSLAKYDNIKIITNRTAFQLDEQIRRVILMSEQKWASKDLTMNIEMDEIIFNGNEDLTEQVWLNLIDNAIKFSHKSSEIFIGLSNWNNSVRFVIEDKGEGMDEKTKSHIFDKFYQGDSSHSKSGNGLGLSIVKRIIDLYGGTIEVNSEIGKGSIFIIFTAH